MKKDMYEVQKSFDDLGVPRGFVNENVQKSGICGIGRGVGYPMVPFLVISLT